ncbi:MAG: hypothetical protein RBT74_12675 [Tenuifilaceae bacterium]|jgi:hypothetical protein|nr:hypothetical protein [Tenuifilaceae bacterium]
MQSEDKKKSPQNLIVDTLIEKSGMKQQVYENTLEAFNLIKVVLHELSLELNGNIKNNDRRIRLDYRDRGKFEAEIRVAGDILIFSMHTNVFEFDRDHSIWKLPYVQADKLNSYCGVINIYNFLTDSFKYNRLDDLGYLIGRLFVNRDNHYFVEGKRQMGFLYNNFGQAIISKDSIKRIVETSMLYSLEFDLLVPPYDMVKIATVTQMNSKIDSSKLQTGKRLGFKFNSDDVLEES